MIDWVHILCTTLLVATFWGSSAALSYTGSTSSTRSFQSSDLNPKDSNHKLRVLSWNVLAQCYVKSPPPSWLDDSSFDQNWSNWLDWNYRREKIAAVLSQSQADVVCLQEIQTSMIDNDLQLQWDELGYETHIQETTNGHPVANVVLLSKALNFTVVWKESRSRALFLIVQPNDSPEKASPPLFIVNVHLQASGRSTGFTENAQTRFSQVRSLVKRIDLAWTRLQEEQCSSSSSLQPSDEDDPCNDWGTQPNILIMGDFNLSPSEPLYSLLVEGTWPDDEGMFKNYLPSKVSVLSASSLPLLPWHDVRRRYKDTTNEQEQEWTYAPTKQIFDYIFVSGNVQTVDRHDYILPKLLAEKVPSNEGNGGRLFWPNQFHPSDHIPIGATVQFRSR